MAEQDRPGRDGLTTFCAVTVAVSVVFWLLGAVVPGEVLVPGLPTSALMFLAPGVGALAVARPALPARPSVPSMAPWWLPMPAVVGAAAASTVLTAGPGGRPSPDDLPGVLAVSALGLLFLVTAWVEELGWTGVMARALADRHAVLPTGVLVGLLWAGVHVVPYRQGGHPWSWVVWQCLFTVAFRVVIVTASRSSRTPMSTAVSLHASYNWSWSLVALSGVAFDPAPAAVLTAVLAGVLVRRSR